MSRRNDNPLGIRKLDVQDARREFRRQSFQEARRILSGHLLTNQDDQLVRCVADALMRGWEAGVTEGAGATRGRVAEALQRGTLVKP
jgi:hypothetical protein